MHFTGTIWRPPYEAWSALLQITAGCTHHQCKFCTLYKDVPFRLSPMEEIEADIQEIYLHAPDVTRLFLTGANPFSLSTEKLRTIANLSKQYLQHLKSIGCFARVTDIIPKGIDELKALRSLGYNRITIGVETGDDEALDFMHKGYCALDILEQCRKLDLANMEYHFFYLTGIYGAGKSNAGVMRTAAVFNQLHPKIIGASMLTVFPDAKLSLEIENGNWQEESEMEKLQEIRLLIEQLKIRTHFAALGASNLFHLQGSLPREKENLLRQIDDIMKKQDEAALREYRVNLKHL